MLLESMLLPGCYHTAHLFYTTVASLKIISKWGLTSYFSYSNEKDEKSLFVIKSHPQFPLSVTGKTLKKRRKKRKKRGEK